MANKLVLRDLSDNETLTFYGVVRILFLSSSELRREGGDIGSYKKGEKFFRLVFDNDKTATFPTSGYQVEL